MRLGGPLQHVEHMVTDRDAVFERLERQCVRGGRRVSEEVRGRAERNYQIIVRHAAVVQVRPPRVEVDAGHLAAPEADAPAPRQGAQREGRVVGVDVQRGDLVEHRGEQVVVAPVDQRDADAATQPRAQMTGGGYPGKAGPQDHHVRDIRGRRRIRRGWPRCQRESGQA